MIERTRESFRKDFWRSLFYASLAFLVFAFAIRLLIPEWVFVCTGQGGCYKAHRWSGKAYYLVGIAEYPVEYMRRPGDKERPDEP